MIYPPTERDHATNVGWIRLHNITCLWLSVNHPFKAKSCFQTDTHTEEFCLNTQPEDFNRLVQITTKRPAEKDVTCLPVFIPAFATSQQRERDESHVTSVGLQRLLEGWTRMPLSQRAPLGSHSTALGDHVCTENKKEKKFEICLLLQNSASYIFNSLRGCQIQGSETGRIFECGIKKETSEQHLFKKFSLDTRLRSQDWWNTKHLISEHLVWMSCCRSIPAAPASPPAGTRTGKLIGRETIVTLALLVKAQHHAYIMHSVAPLYITVLTLWTLPVQCTV